MRNTHQVFVPVDEAIKAKDCEAGHLRNSGDTDASEGAWLANPKVKITKKLLKAGFPCRFLG